VLNTKELIMEIYDFDDSEIKVEVVDVVWPPEARERFLVEKAGKKCSEMDYRTPKDADLKMLWAHLKIKYRDGDELVDEDSLIWDVWKKDDGFVLYCSETKEAIEVPKPKKMGG
jgi:hypothetical protein